MSLRSDTLRTFTFQLYALGAGFVTNWIVARHLGPEGKGLLSFLAYTLFVATTLGGLGLQTAAIHHLGKRRFAEGTISSVQVALGLAAGLVTALAVQLLLPHLQGRMDLTPDLRGALLPVIVLAVVGLNLSGLLLGRGDIQTLNWIQALTPTVWTAGAILFIAFWKEGAVAAGFVWVSAQVFTPAILLLWVALRVRPTRQGFADCARGSLRFGMEAYLANLVWTLVLRIDGFMLGAIAGAASMGIYSIAVLLGEMLWYLPRSLTFALNPRIAQATRKDAVALTLRSSRSAFAITLAGSVVVILVARPLLPFVFGDAFRAAYLPLVCLLPGIVANAIASPLSLFLTQQAGRPRDNAWISGIALAINIGLNLIWIPRFGPTGAALASSVAYSFVAILTSLRVRREEGFSWRGLLLPGREDWAAATSWIPALRPRADRSE